MLGTKPTTLARAITRAIIGGVAIGLVLVTASLAQPTEPTAGDQWLTGTRAQLQTLDKITARIATIEVDTGVVASLATLDLYVHSCVFRPPEMPPDHAALLEIRAKSKTESAGEVFFFGWMFASSPAVSALEHPVYDISVLSCSQ